MAPLEVYFQGKWHLYTVSQLGEGWSTWHCLPCTTHTELLAERVRAGLDGICFRLTWVTVFMGYTTAVPTHNYTIRVDEH